MRSTIHLICRTLIFLSISAILPCYSTTFSQTFSAFKVEWNAFMEHKEFDHEKMNTKSYQEYEFSLLEEFSDQQCPRFRPYIETMDRHDDCRPYLDTQIVLSNGSEMSASLVRTGGPENKYQDFIASQAPLSQSIHLFWQMILENHIDQVVMVTEFFDIDNSELANQYWPKNVSEQIILENDLVVTFIEEMELLADREEYIQIRRFNLKNKGEERIVTHYWYRNWLDNNVPRQLQTILSFINTVKNDKSSLATPSPTLVHCSAGVGRTGIFIVLYHLIERIEHNDQKIDLFNFIASLRWQRPWLLGIQIQYEYCHEINDILQQSNTSILR